MLFQVLLTTLLTLLVAHALADYPLQGDFLSRAKNRMNPIPGVPWYQAMAAHSLIHAGAVGYITNSIGLAFAEFVCHFIIDDLKCSNKINYDLDQALHVMCKLIWVLLLLYVLSG